MLLWNREFEAIKDGSFTLDCPRMKLVPVVEGERERYHGSGTIVLEEGVLSFKFLARKRRSFSSILLESRAKAGQFYEDVHYYWLYAVDIQGRSWRSSKILLRFTPGEGLVAQGRMEELMAHVKRKLPTSVKCMKLWFYGDLDLPLNRSTHSSKKVGDIVIEESIVLDSAGFHSAGYEFSARKDNGWSTIDVKAEDIPEHLGSRIEESLEFMLARSVHASVIELVEATGQHVSIRSRRSPSPSAGSMPPLSTSSTNYRFVGWSLFDSFFRYAEPMLGHLDLLWPE